MKEENQDDAERMIKGPEEEMRVVGKGCVDEGRGMRGEILDNGMKGDEDEPVGTRGSETQWFLEFWVGKERRSWGELK